MSSLHLNICKEIFVVEMQTFRMYKSWMEWWIIDQLMPCGESINVLFFQTARPKYKAFFIIRIHRQVLSLSFSFLITWSNYLLEPFDLEKIIVFNEVVFCLIYYLEIRNAVRYLKNKKKPFWLVQTGGFPRS